MLQKSSEIGALVEALAKAQAEFQPIAKNGYNPHFKCHYSTYSDCIKGAGPSLAKNGLAISHGMVSEGALSGATTLLMHKSGQWISTTDLIAPQKGTAQEQGGNFSYLKRYQTKGILGLADDEGDDDGNHQAGLKGDGGTPQPPQERKTAPVQRPTAADSPQPPTPSFSQWEPKYPRPTGTKALEPLSEGAQKFWHVLVKQCGFDQNEAKQVMEAMFGYSNVASFTRVDFWDFEKLLRTKPRAEILGELRGGGDTPPAPTDADIPF